MADNVYAWTLEEYVLRVELADESLREVVTEGSTDRAFLEDFFEVRDMGDSVAVLDAGYLVITDDEVQQAGFSTGVKGQLLALAMRLRTAPMAGGAIVAVVVDRDYDGLPESCDCDCVFATDYYSMEGYAMTAATMNRFARRVLVREVQPPGRGSERRTSRNACSGSDLMERLEPACLEVSVVRRVVRRTDPPTAAIGSWADYFRVASDGHFQARTRELAEASLASARATSIDLDGLLQEETDAVGRDVRMNTRGRDFIRLLHKLLKSPWGRRVSSVNFAQVDEPTLTTWTLASVGVQVFDREPLFGELAALFGAST